MLVFNPQHGPVVQLGVHAGLSSRRSRVQIPSGPLTVSPPTFFGSTEALRFSVSSTAQGRIAQLVERTPEKREVTGSTPVPTTCLRPVWPTCFPGQTAALGRESSLSRCPIAVLASTIVTVDPGANLKPWIAEDAEPYIRVPRSGNIGGSVAKESTASV
jgi:hypothetical protein